MRRIDYAWIIVGACALTSMTTHGFGRFSYSMIIPTMMKAMSLSKYEAGLIQSFHFGGYLTFSFLSGFLVARYSARLVITLAVLLIGLSMIATGISNSFYEALVMRSLTGIGTGIAYVPAMSLLSVWFKDEKRGLASGLVSIGGCVGLILLSQLVPFIIMTYREEGWRYSWYYLGLVPVFITIICGLFLRNKPADLVKEKAQRPGDTRSSFRGITSPSNSSPLAHYPAHTTESGDKAYSGGRGPSVETSVADHKSPANKNKAHFSRRGEIFSKLIYWHLGAIYATFGFSYVVLLTFYPVYLAYQRQMPSSYYGNLFMILAITSLAGGTFWGKISDLIGRKASLMIVFSMMSASYLIIILTQNNWGDYLGIIVYGFGAWAIPTIMIAGIGDYAGPAMASSALGFITFLFGIGQFLGPWVSGWLAESSGSFIPTFYLAAAVGFTGIIVLVFLKNPERA